MSGGQRLQQLRELNGWSQMQLAKAAEVSQPTIARLEGGSGVSAARRQAVAQALNASEEFLSKPIPERITTSTAWFKAHSDMRAWERDRAHRWGEVGFEALLYLRRKVRLPRPLALHVSSTDPESAAAQMRDQLAIPPDQPVGNLVRTVERAGIRILPLPLDSGVHAAFSILAGENNDEPVIFLFRGESPERNRFTIAHELGHVALHHASRPSDARRAEKDATTFAGALLLPKEPFLRDLNDMSATLSTFLTLKPRWGVSVQAMIMRAFELGRVSDWQKANLFTQLSANGWRVAEPVPLRPEFPRQFSKALSLVYGDRPSARAFARDAALPLPVTALLIGAADALEPPGEPGGAVLSLADARDRRRRRPTTDDVAEG